VQRLYRKARSNFVGELLADKRIQHPGRDGHLHVVREFDDHTFGGMSSEPTNDLYAFAVKRVVTVVNDRWGRFMRSVRMRCGETRMPSLTRSSAAIRPSPQVRFAAGHHRNQLLQVPWNRRRPGARDFQRHHNRNPWRCHRMSVCGFTTINTFRQSRNRDSATSVMRVASSARRGFARRSTYIAKLFSREEVLRGKLGT
jgi:hypothetical protein